MPRKPSATTDFPAADLGPALKWLRSAVVREQRDVAADVDISASYLSVIESGKRTPTDALLDKLLAAIDSDRAALQEVISLAPWQTKNAEYGRSAMRRMSSAKSTERAAAVFAMAPQPTPPTALQTLDLLREQITQQLPSYDPELQRIVDAWPQISRQQQLTLLALL